LLTLRSVTLAAAAALFAISPAFAIPPVPRPAPEFAIQLPDGSQTLLSSLRGKVVCLMFVHTTCPHCQHATQEISKLHSQYGPQGFQPVAVAFNPMAKMLVPDFVRSFGINFPVGYAESDTVMTYLGLSMMERSVVPQILWIDRKGVIRSQTPAMGDEKMLGEPYWRQEIETLLKEPAGASRTRHSPKAARSSLR
jgi:peroxiredoxin